MSLHLQDVAKLNGILRFAHGMTFHHDAMPHGCRLMRQQRREPQATAKGMRLVGCETNDDGSIGMRCQVLSSIGNAAFLIVHLCQSTVQIQLSTIVVCLCRAVQMVDMQGGKGLIIGRIMPLHMQLQRVGQLIIFAEECFPYFWNPSMGFFILVSIHRLARPQCDVVELDHFFLYTTVDQCTEFTIAQGQRFFKKRSGTVVP